MKKTKWIIGVSGNTLLKGKGFYISFNSCPGGLISAFSADNGGSETALYIEKSSQQWRILNGDFRKDYEKLVPKGIKSCIKFYESKKKKLDSSWSC
jgi:hypothetical protein